MPEAAEYYIKRLDTDNLQHLNKLHQAVYGKPVADSFYPKKYDTIHTGTAFVGYIAFLPGDIAIGYYGVIPCIVSYDGQKVKVAQSADTMTHPQYRLKGLFVELANRTYALCRENEINLVFGFPNQNSYHGAVNKLGWKMTDMMDCFTIPVRTVPLEKIAARLHFRRIYHFFAKIVMARFNTDRSSMGNALIDEGYAGVARDADYMAYKTYQPNRVLTFADAKAWVRINNGLIIGDLSVSGKFERAIQDLKKLATSLGATQLQVHLSPGTWLHSRFSEICMPSPSFPVLFQDLDSGLALHKFKFSFADIDIF